MKVTISLSKLNKLKDQRDHAEDNFEDVYRRYVKLVNDVCELRKSLADDADFSQGEVDSLEEDGDRLGACHERGRCIAYRNAASALNHIIENLDDFEGAPHV